MQPLTISTDPEWPPLPHLCYFTFSVSLGKYFKLLPAPLFLYISPLFSPLSFSLPTPTISLTSFCIYCYSLTVIALFVLIAHVLVVPLTLVPFVYFLATSSVFVSVSISLSACVFFYCLPFHSSSVFLSHAHAHTNTHTHTYLFFSLLTRESCTGIEFQYSRKYFWPCRKCLNCSNHSALMLTHPRIDIYTRIDF